MGLKKVNHKRKGRQTYMEHMEHSEKKQGGWKAALKDWLQIIVTAAVIAFLFNTFIIINSDIPSPSMENTIMTGSRVIGSRLHYTLAEPERGDIAIFVFGWRCPECREIVEGEKQDACPFCDAKAEKRAETIHYVKRIIGLPGDTIDIVDGSIYLNGSAAPLAEAYLPEAMNPHTPFHFEVPEGSYFMMGDNRNYSSDARFWENPYISEEKLKAKVLIEYFPKLKRIV